MSEISIDTVVVMKCFACASCGMYFGITEDFQERRRNDHKTFYCPSGCTNVYREDTEADRLRKRLAATEIEATRKANELAAAAAEAARLAARARAGVCSCCNRTFKHLAAHMKNKHPEAV